MPSISLMERVACFVDHALESASCEIAPNLTPLDWAILSAIPSYSASIDDRVDYLSSLNL